MRVQRGPLASWASHSVDVIGYSDRLSVGPGETIGFHVSCRSPRYEAKLVRLIHGDENPAGPGFKEEEVPGSFDGEHPGREQGFASGSYVVVDDAPELRLQGSFTLQVWIYPTTPGMGPQCLLGAWADGAGYALAIGERGDLELRVGGSRVGTGVALRPFTWYFAAGSFDAETGRARVEQEPVPHLPLDGTAGRAEGAAEAPRPADAPFLLAAWHESGRVAGHFNGKLDSPRLFARALSTDELAAPRRGEPPRVPLAAWDLALCEPPSTRVRDTGPHGAYGRCVNMPMRAVTGVRWTGDEPNYRYAPDEYAAIHFHDDDLEDAGWEVAFEFRLPAGLRSGVYAARLRTAGSEDYVPFFVRPRRGAPTSRIAFLVPTLSYLAYGSEQMLLSNPTLPPLDHQREPVALDRYAFEHRLRSLYDRHSDGTGVALTSRLRPITNLRPKYVMPSVGFPHQFNADLHLVDWLETKGHQVDFVTDADLHHEGLELLEPYRVVLTGSHPEYWTAAMLDALEAYLGGGGRFMYLGGNGLYWVTAIDPERPHVVEVRRGQRGTGTWRSAVGENYLQTTGELGGLWRERGRPPQRYVGAGMAAQGFDRALPYFREPSSLDPRASWIFEGVREEGPIGDYGLCLGGAAGFELDRLDQELGTQPHALLLATARGFSDSYQHVVEQVLASDSQQGGSVSPFVRADMVFFETPNGGAVFSTSSITWCGSLSHNGYDNDVSRITDNVLRRFASDEPFP